MKEEYIRKVKKELSVSRNRQREIIRDLNEAFDSAKEHGESERQVIERLGTPENFAQSMGEAMAATECRIGKEVLAAYCLGGVAAFCLIASLIAKHFALPDDVIGQANAMTRITVGGLLPFDIWSVLVIVGLALSIAAAVLIVGSARKKKAWRK